MSSRALGEDSSTNQQDVRKRSFARVAEGPVDRAPAPRKGRRRQHFLGGFRVDL
jgi:hypothetical protein